MNVFIDAVLRLQIRLDDFRKLHDARNRSLKNEDIAYETLRNGLKVEKKNSRFSQSAKYLNSILNLKLADHSRGSTLTSRGCYSMICPTSSRHPMGAKLGEIW